MRSRLGVAVTMRISSSSSLSHEIVAAYIPHDLELDTGMPSPEWEHANPIVFCGDWQGGNADPSRETQVRVLWSEQNLYLRFECRFRELFLFSDSAADARPDRL